MSHISLLKCYNGNCATCAIKDTELVDHISCIRYERRVVEYPVSRQNAPRPERPRHVNPTFS